MADMKQLGQNEASFLFPAITDEELANPAVLTDNYRRSMRTVRLLWITLGIGTAAFIADYVRRGSPTGKKRR